MKRTFKYSHGVSVGALSAAMLCSTSAWSQSPAGTADSAPAGEPAGESGVLEEVVVSAQKRLQNVQDVPIAIAVLSGDQLAGAGIVTTEDFKTIFAGVNVKTTSSQFKPSIRGVGTATSNVENAVALYIDGVYYANQSDARRELNDIEQVAVLKGPQGTLFGRNATAGVIQITTRAPSFEWGGEIKSSIDDYATSRTGAYVTGGLTDNLAFSLAANYSAQGEGWGRNYTTGRDTFKIDHIVSVRGKLLFQPGSNTDITLIGDYTDREDNLGAYFSPLPGTTVNPLVSYVMPPSVYDSYNNDESLNLYKGGGASVSIAHEFGFGKLQSITAYRDFRTGYIIDADMTRAPGYRLDTSHNNGESFSQELQLTSLQESQLNWATGLFYFHYTNALDPVRRSFAGPLFAPRPTSYVENVIDSTETVKSLAPFAQVDYEILPRTRLTLGGRWTYEKRSLDGTQSGTQANGTFVPNIIPAIHGASITARKPTWRVALDYKLTDATLGYVSYNRGFKSGGYNISNLANPPYQPEQLDAYEIGVKTTVLDNKLRLNMAGFYYDYSNLQVLQLLAGSPTISNGAKAELYGLDVDFEAQLSGGLRLIGGFEVLHSEFTSYQNALITFPSPTVGAASSFGDASGNRLPLAQDFTGNLALDYRKDLSFGEVGLNAEVSYNDDYAFDPDNVAKQKAYTNINLAASWTSRSESLTIGLFLRNLLDNEVISYSTAQTNHSYITTYDNPPRTYGVSARLKF